MRPLHLLVLALALLAGTAGFITHRAMQATATPSDAPTASEATAPATADNASEPETPLAWSFNDADGKAQALDGLAGELTVVNFWATWCPPCLREIPAFMALQQQYQEAGVRFVGVALDQPEAVWPFVAEKNINYPVLVGNERVVRFMQTLGNAIGGLPYTVVIRDNAVVYNHQGEWEAADADAVISALLKDSQQPASGG